MSSSASLPSPDDDYAAPLDMLLNKAAWDAALVSVGARIRALEAVKATWEELISEGTGQALAVIQANVEPQLVALTTVINQLKAEVAAAEDAIATILAGGINMSGVVGLSAALALKADLTYVDAAIAALKGGAPEAYDTLVEIVDKLSEDDTAIAGLLTTIATKASKTTKLKVGSGLAMDGTAGADAAPAEGDLSVDRLIKLLFATPAEAAAGLLTGKPIDPAGVAVAIAALSVRKGAAVALSGNTSVDFTGIPSTATRITVLLGKASSNGSSNFLVQLGTAAGIEVTGYESNAGFIQIGPTYAGTTATNIGFHVCVGAASVSLGGAIVIERVSGNRYIAHGVLGSTGAVIFFTAGDKTLADVMTRVRITTVNGTDAFDAGIANVIWE